jgi:hypothetical protein
LTFARGVARSVVLLLGVAVCQVAVLRSAPAAPLNLTAAVSGSTVRLEWLGTAGALGYRLEAGSQRGTSDLAQIAVASTEFTASGVANGTYYVQVRALGNDGLGAASLEVTLTVGVIACTDTPNQPLNLGSRVAGNQVSFTWFTVHGGCGASGHSLMVGSTPGTTNLGTIPIGAAVTCHGQRTRRRVLRQPDRHEREWRQRADA